MTPDGQGVTSNSAESAQGEHVVLTTHEGGLARVADPFVTLNRYLILGIQDSFYQSEKEAFNSFVTHVADCLAIDPRQTLIAIREARQKAPKPNATIIALAIACSSQFQDQAWPYLGGIVRNSSHMMLFIATMEFLRGWGRRPRRLLGQWAQNHDAMDALKYQSRTWLGKTVNQRHIAERIGRQYYGNDDRYYWAIRGEMPKGDSRDAQLIRVVKSLPDLSDADYVKAITDYRLPWEVTPTNRRTKQMWEAVLPHLGSTALLRNMGVMATKDVSPELITDRLEYVNEHPLNILVAWFMYKQGHGLRGQGSWYPNKPVIDALERAFYRSFETLPTNPINSLVAVDVSGSMTWSGLMGINGLSPRNVAAVMAMITVRNQPNSTLVAFASTLGSLDIGCQDTLETVQQKMSNLQLGSGTNTYLPLNYLLSEGLNKDAYIVYTDVETHDRQTERLMRTYREARPLKYVEVAMTANNLTFSYTESDARFVGFSADLPQSIDAFLSVE